jgi:hypothetical protein
MVMGGALAAILVLGAPAWADDLMKKAQENFTPIPGVVPAMKDNTVTHEKVELGTVLFFDPRLSASEITAATPVTISPPAAPTSVGHGRQKGARRAPTVYNAVFNLAQFFTSICADCCDRLQSRVDQFQRIRWTCLGKVESSFEGKRSISWASRSDGSGRNLRPKPFGWLR